MAKISETELQKRLKKIEADKSNNQLVHKVNDQYEYIMDYIYVAYASALANLSAGKITNQSDATTFQYSPYDADGDLLTYRGYYVSKSVYASGDPTDYTWELTSGAINFTSSERQYTTTGGLESALGTPTKPGAGVTWTAVTAGTAIPNTAVWIATRHTINNITSNWVLSPNGAYVNNTLIQDNAVTGVKLAADAVTADKITANAVTANKIAANAITADKIAVGSITSDRLNIDERVTISASGAFAWAKTGPSDTTAGVYMGRESGTPQVEIGNSSYYLRWNGTYLYGVGMITTAPAEVGQSQNITNPGDTRYDIPLGAQTLDIEVSGGGGGGSGFDAVGLTGSDGSSGGSSTVKVYTAGGSLRTTLLTASGGTGSGQSGRTGQSFDPSSAHSLFTGTGGTGGSGTFNNSSAAGGDASGVSAGGGGSIDSGGSSSGSTTGGNAGSYATNASYSVVADGDYLIFSIGTGGSGADGYQYADGGDGTKGAGRVEITAVS